MVVQLSSLTVQADLDASGYVAGGNAKVATDQKMIASANQFTDALDQTDRKLGTTGTAVDRFKSKFVDGYQQATQFQKALADLNRFQDQGKLSAGDYEKALAGINARYGAGGPAAGAAAAGVGVLTAAHDHASQAGTQFRTTLRLAHDFMAGDYRVAAQNAAIEIQEFGRAHILVQAAMNPFVLATVAAAGAVFLVGQRAIEVEDRLRSFNVLLNATGASSQTTAKDLEAAVNQMRAMGIASAEAQAALNAGLRTPGISPIAVPKLAEQGADVGQVLGISSAAGAERLFSALAGGVTTTIALGFALKALSGDTATHAYQMALDGKQVEATNLVYKEIMGNIAGSYTNNLSDFRKSINEVTEAWKGLLDSIANTSSFQASKDALNWMIRDVAAGLQGGGSGSGLVRGIGQGIGSAGSYLWNSLPTLSASPQDAAQYQRDLQDAAALQRGDLLPGGAVGGSFAPNFSIRSGVIMSGQANAFADMLSHAADQLPPGYGIVLTSADRPGGSNSPVGMGSSHVGGNAADFQIIGPNGARYPNTGADVTGLYGSTFANVQAYAQLAYPSLAPYLRTGATFGANGGPISPSSPADIGHMDVRGYPGSGALAVSPDLLSGAGLSSNNAAGLVPSPDQREALNNFIADKQRELDILKLSGTAQEVARAQYEASKEAVTKFTDASDRDAYVQAAGQAVIDKKAVELGKLNEIQKVQTAGVLATADATASADKVDEVAGLRASARAQAQLKAAQENRSRILGYSATDVDVGRETQRILDQNAATAIEAGSKQVAAAQPVVAANQRMAEAAKLGVAAEAEASIQNQAAAQTHNALTAALASGNDALVARALRLQAVSEAQIKANEAAKESVEISHTIDQQKNQIAVGQLEIGLQGQPSDEIARQVANLKAEQDIQGKLSLASDDQKAALLASTDALGRMNVAYSDAVRNQQRLDDGIRQAADTIDNSLLSAIQNVFDGKKITDWGTQLKSMISSIASQILNFALIKPAIGTALSALGFASAAQNFGSFGSLFGGSSSGSVTLTPNSNGTFSLSNVASAASLGNNGLQLAGGGGGIFGNGGLFSGVGNFLNTSVGPSLGFAGPATELGSFSPLGELGSFSPLAESATAGSLFGGATLTSVLPFVGLAAGAGFLLSQLFGNKKPSNASAGGNIDFSTGQVTASFLGGNSQIDQATQGVLSAVSQFTRMLLSTTNGTLGGQVLLQGGVNTGFTADSTLPGYVGRFNLGKDAGQATNVVELALARSLSGVSDTVKTVVNAISDPSQLQAALQFAAVYDNLKKAADSAFSSISTDTQQIGPFEQALNSLNDTFKGISDQASAFGLSLDPVNAALAEATKRLQGDFTTNLQKTLNTASGQDFLNQIQDVIAAQKTNQSDATALGLGTDSATQALIGQVFTAQVNQVLGQLNTDQLNAVITAFSGLNSSIVTLATSAETAANSAANLAATQQATAQVQQYLTGLTTTPSSAVSPQSALDLSTQEYQSSLAKAQGGDLTSLQSLTGSADALVKNVGSFYGSSAAGQTIISQIENDLAGIVTQYTPGAATDPVIAAIGGSTAATQALAASNDNWLQSINTNTLDVFNVISAFGDETKAQLDQLISLLGQVRDSLNLYLQQHAA